MGSETKTTTVEGSAGFLHKVFKDSKKKKKNEAAAYVCGSQEVSKIKINTGRPGG